MLVNKTWSPVRNLFLGMLIVLLFVGCTHSDSELTSELPKQEKLSQASDAVAGLSSMLLGTFSSNENDADLIIVDRRFLLRNSAQSEDGSAWIYYQLNTGEDRKLYRQRIIQLVPQTDNTIIQKTFVPRELEKWVNAWQTPELLDTFQVTDVEPKFQQGCDQIWRIQESESGLKEDEPQVWLAYVDPNTCKIYSKRRKSTIGIESESILSDSMLQQTERGFDAQGNQLFGTKPGEFITLIKQSN